MKFGIITPVFDGCIESLDLLHRELMEQTHTDWVWMLCSNGRSERIAHFVKEKNNIEVRGVRSVLKGKRRLFYLNIPIETEENAFGLLLNISKRRNLCIQEIQSDYIFMIDADAKILNKDMFKIINSELELNPKNICIYKIIHEIGILPIFPISYARIDMLNFCVKTSLAKRIGYPASVNPVAPGNDFWFFHHASEASDNDYLFIDMIFCEHNGNNRYDNLLKKLGGAE